MTIENRQRIEREIVTAIVKDAHKQGYGFMVDNGGDDFDFIGNDPKECLKAMFATDDEKLYITKENKAIAVFHLVYGNDGYDVVADYSDNEISNKLLENANKISEKYS